MDKLKKYHWILVSLILIIETYCLYSLINNYKDIENSNQLYVTEIENLNNKLYNQENIIDTIYITIDNTKEKIQYLEKEYNNASQIIFNESINSDMLYFSEYLSTAIK